MYKLRKMHLYDINDIINISNKNLPENVCSLIYLKDLYDTNFDWNYVCTHNTKIVGFISCSILENIITCNTLCVDYKFRRIGIGRHLMNAIKTEARNKNTNIEQLKNNNNKKKYTEIILRVRSANLVACKFYEEEGFYVVKKDIPYYENGCPANLMVFTIQR